MSTFCARAAVLCVACLFISSCTTPYRPVQFEPDASFAGLASAAATPAVGDVRVSSLDVIDVPAAPV
jgi:hypothetical protein